MKQCLSMCNRMIKFKILLISSLVIFGFTNVFAEKGTFVDEIMFIQYLDENTALEEVRNGNLDLYFFRVSSDRLTDEDYVPNDKLTTYFTPFFLSGNMSDSSAVIVIA